MFRSHLDDVVIYGASLNKHNELTEMFDRLRKHNLKLQMRVSPKRSRLFGTHYYRKRNFTRSKKIEAVKSFSMSKKIKEIQAFIGLADYYRKFISNFSELASSELTQLTLKRH